MNIDEVRRVAVIGAGLMGHGIAQEFAVAGHEVSLTDTNPEVLAGAIDRMRDNLRRMTELAVVDAASAAGAPERVQTASDVAAAVAEADVVIEAASEDLALKQQLFEQLDGLCAPHVILASNSSSFMPSEIGARAGHPERVLVAHYFNPPYLLPIVEVVRGPRTSDDAVSTMRALLLSAGKRPAIVQKEARGFVGNRLQMALWREALALVDDGVASVEDVDAVVRFGFGRRLAAAGPFEVADAAGADLWANVASNLMPDISAATEVPAFLTEMVARGEHGMRTGKGFYAWTPEAADAARERIARSLAATSQLLDS